jgi:hypothetical protein
MRHRFLPEFFIASSVFLSAALPGSARADQYVIVSTLALKGSSELSPKGSGELSLGDVRDIFLGQKLFWQNNERIYPVCSNLASPPLVQFQHDILKMEPDQYTSYWRRKLFSGKGHPPKEFSDDAQALSFIRSNPSSIGILESKPDPRASEGLAVFRVDPSQGQLVRAAPL